MDKTDLVLSYLVLHPEGITQTDALAIPYKGQTIQVQRLSDIIYRLKKYGFSIRTVTETGEDVFGHKTHWTRYFLYGRPYCKSCKHGEVHDSVNGWIMCGRSGLWTEDFCSGYRYDRFKGWTV